MGKYKVLDIFSFLPANVISLEQLEKMFLDSLSEISNNTKLGNEEIVVTCSSQSWFTENIKECSALAYLIMWAPFTCGRHMFDYFIRSCYYDIVNIGLHFILKNVRPYAASCSEA